MAIAPEWRAVRGADIEAIDADLALQRIDGDLRTVSGAWGPLRWAYALLHGSQAALERQQAAALEVLQVALQKVDEAEAAFEAAERERGVDPGFPHAVHATRWARELCAKLIDAYGSPNVLLNQVDDGEDLVRAVLHACRRVRRVSGWVDGHGEALDEAVAVLEEAVGLQAKMVLEVGHGSRYDSEYELVKLQAKRERRAREVDTILAQLDATLQAQAAAFAPHP